MASIFVACDHPDFDKDNPDLKVGGVGHPQRAPANRFWADCVLKALAERGYAVACGCACRPEHERYRQVATSKINSLDIKTHLS